MRERFGFFKTSVVFCTVAIMLLFFSASSVLGAETSGEHKQGTGRVKLAGKDITYLSLQKVNGRPVNFDNPSEVIELPAGEYQLKEVRLKGNYTCRIRRPAENQKITVEKDQQVEFKVGAPLEHKINVNRRGKFLVLNYQLLGIGAEEYTSSDRKKTPLFTICKGDKEIVSDKFKYG
jgi:hypothetical protein